MKKTQLKDALRNIAKQKISYLSIILISALAVTAYLGINYAASATQKAGNDFYNEHNYQDIDLVSTLGMTEEDVEAVRALDGVSDAEGVYSTTAVIDNENEQIDVNVYSLTDRLNQPDLIDGTLPEKENECALEVTSMEKNGLSLGDTVTLMSESGEVPELLKRQDYVITAKVRYADHLKDESYITDSVILTSDAFDVRDEYDPESEDTYYTRIAVRIDCGDRNVFSNNYFDKLEEMENKLEKLGNERAALRNNQINENISSIITDKEKELAEAEKELADSEKNITEGETELADAALDIEDNRIKLNDAKKDLAKAKSELSDAKKKLDDNNKKLDDSKSKLDKAKKKLDKAKKELDSNKTQLDKAKKQIDAGQKNLDAAKKEIDSAQTELESVKAQLDEKKKALDESKEQLDQMKAEIEKLQLASAYEGTDNSKIAAIQAQYNTAQKEYDAGKVKYDSAYAEYEKNLAVFNQKKADYNSSSAQLEQSKTDYNKGLKAYQKGKKDYDSGLKEYNANKKKYENGKKEYSNGLSKYNTNSRDYSKGLSDYEKSSEELADAEDEYSKSERELADGRKEYEDGLIEYADSSEELDEKKKEFDDIEKCRWVQFDINSNLGYVSLDMNAGSLASLGKSFALLFVVLGAMVCYTTIGKMVDEQRKLVGASKALGLFNIEIFKKYIFFGISAIFVGIVVGVSLAYFVMQKLIVKGNAATFAFGEAKPVLIVGKTVAVLIFGLALGFAATYIACSKLLRSTAVILMKEKAPKSVKSKGKKSKAGSLYGRLILRNMLSDISRVCVTAVCVAGCCALLVIGFTLKFSVNNVIVRQFERIINYDYNISYSSAFSESASSDIVELLDKQGCSYTELSSEYINYLLDGQNNVVEAYITDPSSVEEYYNLLDVETGEKIKPSSWEDGVLIQKRIAEICGVGAGDSLTLYDSNANELEARIAGVFDNYIGGTMFISDSYYEELFGKPVSNNLFFVKLNGVNADELKSELSGVDGFKSFVRSDIQKDFYSALSDIMNWLIACVIIMAAMMASVVILNLSNMYLMEKQRELAIMRINGFTVGQIIGYMVRETAITTTIGIVLGIGAGQALALQIIHSMEKPSLQLVRDADYLAWTLSTLITLLFAFIINYIVMRKVKKLKLTDLAG